MRNPRRVVLLVCLAVILLGTGVLTRQCFAGAAPRSVERNGYRYSTVYVDSNADLGAFFQSLVPGRLFLGLYYVQGADAERRVGTVAADGSKQRILNPVVTEPGDEAISIPATAAPYMLIYRPGGSGFRQSAYFFESEAERSLFAHAARVSAGAGGTELWQLGGFCDLSGERVSFAGYDEPDAIGDGLAGYEPLFGPQGRLTLLVESSLQADGSWSDAKLVRVAPDLSYELEELGAVELVADTYSGGWPSKALIAADGSVRVYSHDSGNLEDRPELQQLGRALVRLNTVQHGGLTSVALLPDGFALYSQLDAPNGYFAGSVDLNGTVSRLRTIGHASTASGLPRLSFWLNANKGMSPEARRAQRAEFRKEGRRQPPTTLVAASEMLVVDESTAAIVDRLYQRVTFVTRE